MKLPKGSSGKRYIEPERAASKDQARPVLLEPWLSIDSEGKGTLYATDSWVAVRIPVELDDNDTPGAVPAVALKAARSGTFGHVLLDGDATAIGRDGTVKVVRPDWTNHEPPNVDQLFPPEDDDGLTVKVALDVDKLGQISKALGADRGIILTLPVEMIDEKLRSGLKPMHVRAISSEHKGEGLLMPIRMPS